MDQNEAKGDDYFYRDLDDQLKEESFYIPQDSAWLTELPDYE